MSISFTYLIKNSKKAAKICKVAFHWICIMNFSWLFWMIEKELCKAILILWFYVTPNLKFKSWMDSVYGSGENSLSISTGILIEVEVQSENQTTSDFEMKKQVYLLSIVMTIKFKLFIQISIMYIQTIVCPPFWSTVLQRFLVKKLM